MKIRMTVDVDFQPAKLRLFVRDSWHLETPPKVLFTERGEIRLNASAMHILGSLDGLDLAMSQDDDKLTLTLTGTAGNAKPVARRQLHASSNLFAAGFFLSQYALPDLSTQRYLTTLEGQSLHVHIHDQSNGMGLVSQANLPIPDLLDVPAGVDLDDDNVISLVQRGQLGIRMRALETLGLPKAARLFYNADAQLIALESCSPQDPNAFNLTVSGKLKRLQLSCMGLLRLCRIETETIRHYVATLDEGRLLIDFAGPAYGKLRGPSRRGPFWGQNTIPEL